MAKHVWEISNKYSTIHFKLKYFEISNIIGAFLKFSGKVITDEFFINSAITFNIEAGSVETLNMDRNAKLRSGGFLSAAKHPFIKFISVGGCKQSVGKIWEVTGDLTLKEITKPVTLVIHSSDVKKNIKKPVAIFRLFGKINRKDFEFGDFNDKEIGNDIHVNAEIYMVKKPQ